MSAPKLPTTRGSLGYSYFVVIVLAVAYMLSFMDRTLISLLIAPIKAEFSLSDTEIGMLIGFGFVVFYALLGIPFGALADRTNRRNLILGGLVAWSLATSASGLVVGFGGLLAMRGLVGVGEATLSPAAYSTIADRFPSERLGFAIGLYAAGVSIGGGLAMAFGGILVEWSRSAALALPLIGTINGWRLAFVAVGLLGLPLALLIWLTVQEAPRTTHLPAPPLADLWRFIAARPAALGGSLLAFGLANIANYVVFLWAAPLFMRVHGLDARTTGLAVGAVVGVFGTAGMMLGGVATDRLARRGVGDGTRRVIWWGLVVQVPLLPLAIMADTASTALLLLVPVMMATTAASSVQGTAIQLLTPARMRGRMVAVYLLIVTLVGMGLGPLAIGMLSDRVFPGARGLAPSMAIVALFGLLSALLVMAATRRAVSDAMVRPEDL